MYEIHITHTSMGVRVEVPVRQIEIALKTWAEQNLHAPKMGKDHGRITVEQGDGYYAYLPGTRTFIFHKTFLEQILSVIKNTVVSHRLDVKLIEHDVTKNRKQPYGCAFPNHGFDLVVTDPDSRFYYQNDVVEAALDPLWAQVIFAIQTGRGKTKSLQKVMVKMGVRTALIMRPTYKDKWIFDCCDDPTGLLVEKEHVLICQGVQSIYDAYEMGQNGELDAKDIRIIIIPTVTLQLFLKEYMNTSATNAINLDDFYDTLGVGLVGYDEVHEHFLLVYLSGVMLNPPKTVEMSATLEPGAAKVFIRERYKERFPIINRLSIPYIPVVDVRGLYYTIEDKKLAWWATKMTPYNHKVFEGKLMREGYHISYCEMWYNLMEKTYLANYEPGQKIIILFATVDMCEFYTNYVREKLSTHPVFCDLMVAKYNGGDSYDDFIMAEIGVSTPNKAGTAIDKPGTVHMYVTTPIDDQQLNEQIAGRPRPVIWDMNPKVWFGHCMNIPKHGSYLNSRMNSLKGKVLSFMVATSPYVVRKSYDNASTSSRTRSPLRRLEFTKVSRKRSKGVSRGRRRR
ncbi:DNA helicase [Erwinia phage vB_EamM_ChrisDB]|uniref:DNA helicase n=1 Tax=Erwinia phage vB_EamM_ChrisDB TaxID=1883371 RepID=UPI00081CD2ED|nr:DNA helicase [Erwinia phage vB_EamM_ChrisDB]ANZ48614.1 putative ATP-dependent DNA helicase [Erwinia phage vB_EamM_ChrisDB]